MLNKELIKSFERISETMVDISNTMFVINESLKETQIVQAKLVKQMDELNDRVTRLEMKVG